MTIISRPQLRPKSNKCYQITDVRYRCVSLSLLLSFPFFLFSLSEQQCGFWQQNVDNTSICTSSLWGRIYTCMLVPVATVSLRDAEGFLCRYSLQPTVLSDTTLVLPAALSSSEWISIRWTSNMSYRKNTFVLNKKIKMGVICRSEIIVNILCNHCNITNVVLICMMLFVL